MFDKEILKTNKADLQKAADKVAVATPKTPTGFTKIAWDIVFPLLPTLLLAFAPKLVTSKKSVAILRRVDETIDQILEQVPEEEE
jgi:hypothetical protein